MIDKLLQLVRTTQSLENKGVAHFNTTLPILLEVLKKTKHQHYLLRLGNQILETKSLKELEIGGRYFALMRHSSLGGIMLSSLKAEPKIPQYFLESSLQDLKEILKTQKRGELQDFALHKMTTSETKEEFLSWGFFLLGLQKEVLSLWLKEEEKRAFLQLRRKKNHLEFYGLFPHLGELSGRVFAIKEGVRVEIDVLYEGTAFLLDKNRASLKGIDELLIRVRDKINPLFLAQEQLLDLKI